MNVIEMLEMYLGENNVNCHIPRNDKNSIVVHLKHSQISDTISISVSQVTIRVKDSNVYGYMGKPHYSSTAPTLITTLEDPKAFRKMTGWIKRQEILMRKSIEAIDIANGLNLKDFLPSYPEPPSTPPRASRPPS